MRPLADLISNADRLGLAFKHDALPEIMGSMTMRYLVKNPRELATFEPDDPIEAMLLTDDPSGDAWLENFRL
jgi:Cu/Ag efflux protein CusF